MNSTRDDVQRMLDHLDCTNRRTSAENFRKQLGISLKGILEDCITMHKIIDDVRKTIGGVK